MAEVKALVEDLQAINSVAIGAINDNEEKSQKFRNLFVEEYFADDAPVHTPGDPPHAVNLCVGDVLKHPLYTETVTQASFVADKFKNTRLKMFLKKELDIEDGRVGVNMPVITRWGSHLKMFKSLANYREEILAIIQPSHPAAKYVDPPSKKQNPPNPNPLRLRPIVTSTDFWTKLDQLINVLNPLVDAITALEKDASISNVKHKWSILENTYSTNSANLIPDFIKLFVSQKLKDRWTIISNPIHDLSFLLDPRFRDISPNTLVKRSGISLLQKVAGNLWSTQFDAEFTKFREKRFPFDLVIPIEADPVKYWRDQFDSQEGKLLATVALKVITFPQSSASVERSFSALRRVHTWERSSLGREKLSKLIYIYVNCAALRKLQKRLI